MQAQNNTNSAGTQQPLPPETGNEKDALTEKLVGKLLQTREFKDMTGVLMPEVLRVWAGDSGLKKMVSKFMSKTVEKTLLSPDTPDGQAPTMWDDSELTGLLMEKFPALVNMGIKGTGGLSKALDSLPDEEKKTFMGEALNAIDSASLGEALATFLRIINEVHETQPTFIADQLYEPIKGLVENLDFADIEDLVKHSQMDIVGLIGAVNEVFDRYPAKVVCLMGVLPALLNVVVAVLNESMDQVDNMPPELITEVLLSLMKDIDGKAIGKFVNTNHELLRKIHTGSALLGPPGHPEFTAELTNKLKEVVSAIDTEILWKGRQAIAEVKDATSNARFTLLRDNPDLLARYLEEAPVLLNARIRSMQTTVSLLEEFDNEEMARAVANGVLRLDLQDLAEVLNLYASVANRVQKKKPDLAMNILESFAYSVDIKEVDEAIKWIAKDVATSFKPIIRAMAPHIIEGVCECLAPENDSEQEGVDRAIDAIRKLMNPKEAD